MRHPWCQFIVLLLLVVVVEIILSAPFLSFLLLSSTLRAPSGLLVLLMLFCSHTLTQTVLWRSFRLRQCEIFNFAGLGRSERKSNTDTNVLHIWTYIQNTTVTVVGEYYFWRPYNNNFSFVDFNQRVLALRLICMLIYSEISFLLIKTWQKCILRHTDLSPIRWTLEWEWNSDYWLFLICSTQTSFFSRTYDNTISDSIYLVFIYDYLQGTIKDGFVLLWLRYMKLWEPGKMQRAHDIIFRPQKIIKSLFNK